MFPRICITLAILLGLTPFALAQPKKKKPNVIVIMTDDQGHGDLGCHGNPVIKTPNLDKLAKKSVRMRNFYVSPVCSPTRASLLTGRYNYRTGVVDTFVGRSMMHTDEVTLAELLRALGYHTGIFGKWHLGDNYPLRAMDQGFMEALVLKGGGIGQPSDPPGGESYFNPILQHNGKAVKKDGYCTDIFTDAAIDFISKNKDSPFFCYVAFNCPHGPLQVPKKYHDLYKNKIKLGDFPKIGFPIEGKVPLDETEKIYGMITNIDDNVGRLLAKLDELGIADDTIVIFLTDNGPQQPRYNSGMRGRKGSVFEGGTRVPFFVCWPAGFKGDRDIDRIAAHIDVTPTLVEACGGMMPPNRAIDGKNLLPLWKSPKIDWPDRSLFFQWHRGDVPKEYRACAVRTQKWRLVQPDGVQENSKIDPTKWMLFDIENDPFETKNLAAESPAVVKRLKGEYEGWFLQMSLERGFVGPWISIGSEKENPVILTRQDWRGPQAGWTPKSIGYWDLRVEKAGIFEITATLPTASAKGGVLHLRFPDRKYTKTVDANAKTTFIRGIDLPEGRNRFEIWIAEGESVRGMRFVEVRKIN
ncbi:MAG: arylsulfatase [Gemmataceae bacterium]|nr:arylsulfatase [Gemmataceae bacterium]